MSAPLSRALANSSLAFYLFPVFYFGKRDIYGAGVALDKHFPQNYTDYCFCQTSGDLSYESGMTSTDKTLYVFRACRPQLYFMDAYKHSPTNMSSNSTTFQRTFQTYKISIKVRRKFL